MMSNRIIGRVIVAVMATTALLGIAGKVQAAEADHPSPALAVAASVTSEALAGSDSAAIVALQGLAFAVGCVAALAN